MSDTNEFGPENLINVSTQNNFCGYYVLARRIINDANFAVILDKFNQFYQTNWYPDQLAEVVENMHPEQADIMLGLVVHHQHSPSSGESEGLFKEDLTSICEAFGYDPSIFGFEDHDPLDSSKDKLQDQSDFRKILILFDPPKGNATKGHYYLVEPDMDKVTEYKEKCSPDAEHTYQINNSGGKDFVENIKKSVTEIKPNWTDDLKNQQIQEDENIAWKLAAEEARRAGLTFFTSERTISNEEKTRLGQLQNERWLIFQT